MIPARKYSVSDIEWIIHMFRDYGDGELATAEIDGMEKLLGLLQHYEFMSESDIEAEVHRHFEAKKARR